jgi:hypothetical protein
LPVPEQGQPRASKALEERRKLRRHDPARKKSSPKLKKPSFAKAFSPANR